MPGDVQTPHQSGHRLQSMTQEGIASARVRGRRLRAGGPLRPTCLGTGHGRRRGGACASVSLCGDMCMADTRHAAICGTCTGHDFCKPSSENRMGADSIVRIIVHRSAPTRINVAEDQQWRQASRSRLTHKSSGLRDWGRTQQSSGTWKVGLCAEEFRHWKSGLVDRKLFTLKYNA
eukprot:44949-Chlamydomonas_euryale.AAC.2